MTLKEVAEQDQKTLWLPQPNLPFARPDIWTPEKRDLLNPRQKMDEILLEFALIATPLVGDMVDKKKYKGKVGESRGDEDYKSGLDEVADDTERDIFVDLGKKWGLAFFVQSEHQDYMIGRGKPKAYVYLDPIENTDEDEKDIDLPRHINAGSMDENGNLWGAIDSNLFTFHIGINRNGKNYELNPRLEAIRQVPKPPVIDSIYDPRFLLNFYLSKTKYHEFFNDNLLLLNHDRDAESTLHGKGGAHAYFQMAVNGGMYLMGMSRLYAKNGDSGEPISEILSGYHFAISAGQKAWSIEEDLNLTPFHFDPKYYLRNPDKYRTDRIPGFLVSGSPKLTEQVLRYLSTKPLDFQQGILGRVEKSLKKQVAYTMEDPGEPLLAGEIVKLG